MSDDESSLLDDVGPLVDRAEVEGGVGREPSVGADGFGVFGEELWVGVARCIVDDVVDCLMVLEEGFVVKDSCRERDVDWRGDSILCLSVKLFGLCEVPVDDALTEEGGVWVLLLIFGRRLTGIFVKKVTRLFLGGKLGNGVGLDRPVPMAVGHRGARHPRPLAFRVVGVRAVLIAHTNRGLLHEDVDHALHPFDRFADAVGQHPYVGAEDEGVVDGLELNGEGGRPDVGRLGACLVIDGPQGMSGAVVEEEVGLGGEGEVLEGARGGFVVMVEALFGGDYLPLVSMDEFSEGAISGERHSRRAVEPRRGRVVIILHIGDVALPLVAGNFKGVTTAEGLGQHLTLEAGEIFPRKVGLADVMKGGPLGEGGRAREGGDEPQPSGKKVAEGVGAAGVFVRGAYCRRCRQYAHLFEGLKGGGQGGSPKEGAPGGGLPLFMGGYRGYLVLPSNLRGG